MCKKKDIYDKAKKDILENPLNFASSYKKMIELECCKYETGFLTYYYALRNKTKNIDSIIDCRLKNYQEERNKYPYVKDIDIGPDLFTMEYTEILLEIGFSIVEKYPYKALEIYTLISDTYERAGVLPNETIDLSIEIIDSFASDDIEVALEHLDIVEGCFKLEALENIKCKTTDTKILKKIEKMIVHQKQVMDE